MDAWLITDTPTCATALIAVTAERFGAIADSLSGGARQWCAAQDFSGQAGQHIVLPDAQGGIAAILAGCDPRDPVAALAWLPQRLAPGAYRLDPRGVELDAADVALGWALGAYRYTRYRKARRAPAQLCVGSALAERVRPLAQATCLVRELVNTPTEDLGPEQLAAEVRKLAASHGADYCDWVGDELIAAGFPTIHAVGRASHRAPRLAQLTHGPANAPHLVLVGKGVCFDSGGLDIKSAEGMRWMKKDMGGAAHAIALAGLVLEARLPLRLTLLIPAVENSIAGNALRPGEVITTRAGISVEIDNTDAEGRLILCDALAYAAEQKPDLILDFATLTGAARVALGPELPALFCNRDDLAAQLLDAAHASHDPMWRLPLWRPYLTLLESHVADLANAGASRQAGAITAALYLERFLPETQAWAHLDVYAWNDADRPGHPRGGEAQGLRAYFRFLQQRYR